MWCKILVASRWRKVINNFLLLWTSEKIFLKSSVPLSPPVQQLLLQKASMGPGTQRGGRSMVGTVTAPRTLKSTHMRNFSMVQGVSTCFSFNEPSLWIEAKAFRKLPARLTRAASCFSGRAASNSKNTETAVAHCHQLEQCQLWGGKIWSLPEPETWTSMRIWPLFLWWDEKRGKKNFCFWISQMFLASFGSEIAHSQIRPVTLQLSPVIPDNIWCTHYQETFLDVEMSKTYLRCQKTFSGIQRTPQISGTTAIFT